MNQTEFAIALLIQKEAEITALETELEKWKRISSMARPVVYDVDGKPLHLVNVMRVMNVTYVDVQEAGNELPRR